jgi:hypothetical protein
MPERDRDVAVPVHEFWWLHDARWYQGVLKRFGQEAANEINAEAMLFVCRRVARWYTARAGVDFASLPMEEFVKWFAEIPRIMWPESMMHVAHTARGEDAWESVITTNFALRMLRAARTLDGYECPCPQMREGWFAGMGVRVRDRRVECQRLGGTVCRFRSERERDTDPGPTPPDRHAGGPADRPAPRDPRTGIAP